VGSTEVYRLSKKQEGSPSPREGNEATGAEKTSRLREEEKNS